MQPKSMSFVGSTRLKDSAKARSVFMAVTRFQSKALAPSSVSAGGRGVHPVTNGIGEPEVRRSTCVRQPKQPCGCTDCQTKLTDEP